MLKSGAKEAIDQQNGSDKDDNDDEQTLQQQQEHEKQLKNVCSSLICFMFDGRFSG